MTKLINIIAKDICFNEPVSDGGACFSIQIHYYLMLDGTNIMNTVEVDTQYETILENVFS